MKLPTECPQLNVVRARATALECETSAFCHDTPPRGLVVRISRSVLFIGIFVIYTGALPFFITFSLDLLYGTYVVMGACAVGILSFERVARRSLLSIIPYLVWLLVFYCLWGTLVTVGNLPEDEVIKTFVKNLIVLSAFALAVIDRRDLARAANWLQIGALFNLAICLWEVWDPELILTLAVGRDPNATAFNLLRPAGLWRNPDEAAFAFVFAFLLCHWAGRWLAWIGRLACLIGIYLTASRTGAYVLALCGAVHFVLKLRSEGFFFRWLKWFSLSLAAMVAAALVLTESSTLRTVDLANQWKIRRIIDFAENRDRDAGEPTRLQIAQEAMERIFERPWTGHGIFSFQLLDTLAIEPAAVSIAAHNVFLTVWGETGIPGIITYSLVLALGICRIFHSRIAEKEASVLLLMWISYLVIGLTWHNQFTSFSGMLYAALLFHLPSVIQRYFEAARR